MGGGFGGIGPFWCVDGELAKFCRVLTYDRAGLGRSERIKTAPTMGERAQDLAALLDAVGVREAALFVGWSLGGLILQNFSARYPERVSGLLFLDPTPPDLLKKAGPFGRWAFSTAFGFANRFQLLLAQVGAFKSQRGRNVLRKLAKAQCGPHMPAGHLDLFVDALAQPAFHRAMILEANKLPNLCRETLQLVTERSLPRVPTILLAATHRAGAAAKLDSTMYDRLRELAPAAEFRELPEIGHLVPVEAPDSVIQAVRDLLARMSQ
jgi:pimeloyl-ACP methyl ester carboxylesterase